MFGAFINFIIDLHEEPDKCRSTLTVSDGRSLVTRVRQGRDRARVAVVALARDAKKDTIGFIDTRGTSKKDLTISYSRSQSSVCLYRAPRNVARAKAST